MTSARGTGPDALARPALAVPEPDTILCRASDLGSQRGGRIDAEAPAPAALIRPLHVLGAFCAAAAIWWSARPLNDYDSFWHVELGRQIVHSHSLRNLGSWWLAVPAAHGWVTSQWLSEVVMYLLTAAGGWHALIAARVLAMAALVIMLGRALLRHREPYLAVPVFLITLGATAGAIQDRPQTAGLIFVAWLGPAVARLWRHGSRPPIALTAACCLTWAQFHGSWILAPLAFGVLLAGSVLDPQARSASRLRSIAACLLASLTGLVNPHGLASFALPMRFDAAGKTITEWEPTTLVTGFTVMWGLLVAITFLAWSRTSHRVPVVAVVWVLFWTAFGMQSYRNVTPAALLIAPFTLFALEDWYSDLQQVRGIPVPTVGRAEARALVAVCAALVLGGTLVCLIRVPGIDVMADVPARREATWVAAQPHPMRIFNNWNATGALVGLSDHKARLVIDGRADLWGAAYIDRVRGAELMQPGWQSTVGRFHPDAVVLLRTSPLVSGLTMQGWRVAVQDHEFALLVPH